MSKSKAIFVDRDDTVIHDPGYLSDPRGVRLLPGSAGALRRLADEGFKVVLVTNQSGIARGMMTEETLRTIHAELVRQLSAGGARLDGIYYCPFHPEGTVERYRRESDLRKPAPGMLLAAAADLDLDLSASWMVGDSGRDVEAGKRAGCRTIQLISSEGKVKPRSEHADFTAADLPAAAEIILRRNN